MKQPKKYSFESLKKKKMVFLKGFHVRLSPGKNGPL